MSRPDSPAVAFWRLLETGAKLPHGTKHLTTDAQLCALVAKRLELPAGEVFDALYGVPVKAAYGVAGWAAKEPDTQERLNMLLAWAHKNRRAA